VECSEIAQNQNLGKMSARLFFILHYSLFIK